MVWTKNATPEVNAQSRYPAIIAVNVIFTGLMLTAVSTRIFARRSSLGPDDYIVIVTAIFSVVYNCFCIAETHWGLGLPIALRPRDNTHTFKVLSYAGKPWYQFGIAGFKLALCISYLRFLRGINGKAHHVYRWTIIGIAITSTVLHAMATLTNFFFCMPLSKNFNEDVPGYCIPFLPLNYTIAAVTITCDIVVFLLPIQIFRRLQMSPKIKIEICAMFALGLLTTICSGTRAAYFYQVENGNGDSTMVVVLGTVEFNVGLIACCLPFMRGIILRSWTQRATSDQPSHSAYALETYRTIHSVKAEARNIRSDSEEGIIDQDRKDGIVRTVSYQVSSDINFH